MAIEFTRQEIAELQKHPDALRLLAEWHDFNQAHAESVGLDCNGDEMRAADLREAAAKLQGTH